MATYTAEQMHQVWKAKAAALAKSGRKTRLQSAKFMVARTRSFAPRRRGVLAANIKKRPIKKGWNVESWVPGPFKYNLWVNRTNQPTPQGGTYAAPRMRWNKFEQTPYGTGPADYTGTPGFFSIAMRFTAIHYRKMTNLNTNKALRAGA